eukprot:gene7559-711_t
MILTVPWMDDGMNHTDSMHQGKDGKQNGHMCMSFGQPSNQGADNPTTRRGRETIQSQEKQGSWEHISTLSGLNRYTPLLRRPSPKKAVPATPSWDDSLPSLFAGVPSPQQALSQAYSPKLMTFKDIDAQGQFNPFWLTRAPLLYCGVPLT